MPRVHLVTLGCPKNTVDSERMHQDLAMSGYELTEEPEAADVIVVNTCGFIEPAKQESIATILEAADYKTQGSCKAVVVTGCLAQRYRDELRKELTEADLIVGLAEERNIARHCDTLLGRTHTGGLNAGHSAGVHGRHLLTPAHWGYLRISDGCDRACSFCAIPGIRGHSRSESIDDLVSEARMMVDVGVKEIALISQDTMRYGADLYGSPKLVELLRGILDIDGVHWLRLLYTYPAGWRDDLIDLLAADPRLCGYVDMPIQHASDELLKAMNRGTTKTAIRRLVERLRSRIPNLTIRSSVIVGFPGERDAHFRELLEFVEEMQFNRLVGFTYSHEDGTEAGRLADDVPEDQKRERLDDLMMLQGTISGRLHERCVGERFRVLVDRACEEPEFDYVGRTRMDAPEIDGEVFVSGPAEVGDFAVVEITEPMDYDLIGRSLEDRSRLPIEPAAGERAPGP